MRSWISSLALLLAVSASALDPGTNSVGLRGGLALPGGRTSDSTKQGFVFGGELRHQWTTPLSIAADAEYLGLADRNVSGTEITTGGDVFALGGFGQWDFHRAGHTGVPFVIVGGGLSRVSTRTEGPGVPQSHATEWHPGVLAGGGVEFPWTNLFSVGFSGRYRSMGDAGYIVTGNIQINFSLAPRQNVSAPQKASAPVPAPAAQTAATPAPPPQPSPPPVASPPAQPAPAPAPPPPAAQPAPAPASAAPQQPPPAQDMRNAPAPQAAPAQQPAYPPPQGYPPPYGYYPYYPYGYYPPPPPGYYPQAPAPQQPGAPPPPQH